MCLVINMSMFNSRKLFLVSHPYMRQLCRSLHIAPPPKTNKQTICICKYSFYQKTNAPLLLQSLCWIHLGAVVFLPYQTVLLHIHWCWSCSSQPLWHVDISNHQGDLPKPGCNFPFWKNFSVSQINWMNPPNRRWRPDSVSDLASIWAGWRHLNTKNR